MAAAKWALVWQELRDHLAQQPSCPEHPAYPHVCTVVQRVINDIVKIDEHGLLVRSPRTLHEDYIEQARLETWWHPLLKHKTASLCPGDGNTPHPWRSRVIGAILVTCLPRRIRLLDTDTLELTQ